MTEIEIEREYHDRTPELKRAINQWKHGNTIPLDLAVALMEQGHDVESLAAKYRN
jgi:hypothetical protein